MGGCELTGTELSKEFMLALGVTVALSLLQFIWRKFISNDRLEVFKLASSDCDLKSDEVDRRIVLGHISVSVNNRSGRSVEQFEIPLLSIPAGIEITSGRSYEIRKSGDDTFLVLSKIFPKERFIVLFQFVEEYVFHDRLSFYNVDGQRKRLESCFKVVDEKSIVLPSFDWFFYRIMGLLFVFLLVAQIWNSGTGQ